jgi:hypothetical protein
MKKLGVFTMAIALMAPLVFTAGSAGAATLVTCAKPSGSVAFVPGLGATPKLQTTTFSLPIKGCKGGGVTSGSSKGSAKGTTKSSCGTFATAGKTVTKVTITWNTKKTSTATLTTLVSIGGGKTGITATVSGRISAGLFKGKTLKTKVKVTIPSGSCTDAKPLKKATLTGLAAVTIG